MGPWASPGVPSCSRCVVVGIELPLLVCSSSMTSPPSLAQVLIASCGSLQAATPYLAGTLAVTIACWMRAAQALARLFVAGGGGSGDSGTSRGSDGGGGSNSSSGMTSIKGKIVKGRRKGGGAIRS